MSAKPVKGLNRLDFRCHAGLVDLVKDEAKRRGLPVSIWLRLVVEEKMRSLGYDPPDPPETKPAGGKPTGRKPRTAPGRKE